MSASQALFRITQLSSVYDGKRGGSGSVPVLWLSEETRTELFLSHVAGESYDIGNPCPHADHPSRSARLGCACWNGTAAQGPFELFVRKFSKFEEGGRKGTSNKGFGADFLLTFDGPTHSVRLLVQAKLGHGSRVSSGMPPNDFTQHGELVDAAKKMHAVPVYAIYPHRVDEHSRLKTKCKTFSLPADQSVIIVPAKHVESAIGSTNSVDRHLEQLVTEGHPIQCIGGCSGLRSASRATSPFDAARAFALEMDPKYKPPRVDEAIEHLGERVQSVTYEARYYRPVMPSPPQPRSGSSRRGVPKPDASTVRLGLIVRLGPWSSDDRIDHPPGLEDFEVFRRDGHGFPSPDGMDPHESVRLSASGWWVLNHERASQVRYLIAMGKGSVRGIYDVDDFVIEDSASARSRVAFKVTRSRGKRDRLEKFALDRVGAIGRARNPVTYFDIRDI